MIEAQRISKSYGHFRAVDDISFSIPKGQCVGLLGPNGAGKSTTIKMITGFLPPSAGGITIGGLDTIHDSVASRRLIGYLPESNALYPEMRVRDYLAFRSRLFPLRRAIRKSGIEHAIERCWLKEVARKRIAHLSKGYKQRVGLAAALVHNPPVLILDEPTNGLDPSQIRETRSLIKLLAADRTVLVSSHILPEIEQTCDRVIIMSRGRVRADGSPRGLIGQVHVAAPHVLEVGVAPTGRERIHRALAAVPGAATVTLEVEGTDDHWARFTVMPKHETPDLREPIARAVGIAGVVCRELRRPLASLEQVFMRVIETDEPAVNASAGSGPGVPARAAKPEGKAA